MRNIFNRILPIHQFWRTRKNSNQEPESKQNKEIKENGKNLVLRQIFVSLGPLLLTVATGFTFGYSAILLPHLQRENSTIKTDSEQASWIASIAALPLAFGCIIAIFLIEYLGRKTIHILACLPIIIGWLLIYFADSIDLLLSGRFITGLWAGIIGPVTGIYISEISDPKCRGFLLGSISFSVSAGLLLSHLIGTFLDWQITALSFCSLPIIALVIMFFVPESPTYLIKKGRIEDGKESFKWCRGVEENASRELDIIIQRNQEKIGVPNESLWKRISAPQFWKPLAIVVIYIVSNQLVGVNAIAFYTLSIMKNIAGQSINEYVSMLSIDLIRLIMSIIACILLRKFGRRPLAVISGLGTFSSLFVLSIYTYLTKSYLNIKDNYALASIPMIAIFAYITFVSIGSVPIPWALTAELFPVSTRNIGSSITSCLAFASFFMVVKLTPFMFENFGIDGTFSIFGLVGLASTIFVWAFLPETKGRPLHEIEEFFKNKSARSADTSTP